MKNNRGITLMSLVVTIIVLLLLSTVTVNVGIETYDMIKVQNFVSKLKVIQGKVDNISEETDDVSGYGFTKLTDLSTTDTETYNFFSDILANPDNYNIDITNSWNSELDGDINNYYYFARNDLEKIGLKDQDMTVIINFKSRNVIAKKGVEKDNKIYYRQYDLQGGDKLISSSKTHNEEL